MMRILIAILAVLFMSGCSEPVKSGVEGIQPLKIGEDKRSIVTADGKPFFWLGDTGWLLFVKLNREDIARYLAYRKEQGFNVIQVMTIHDINNAVNVYGDSALVNKNIAQPLTTEGADHKDSTQYDFWDHVDYAIDEAARNGIYMALVPVWGSNVKAGNVNQEQARAYAGFLAERYKNKPNIIWLNGGDIKGSDSLEVWKVLGSTLKQKDPAHLMTFHPRGRTSSSDWFHNEPWLDFNMFQSGHKTYAQDTNSNETRHYGEDNWRYVMEDFKLQPAKPTIDGEPSYEHIPYGLHDSLQPRWGVTDMRRYLYWSVLPGAFGFTYGNNAVMQFHHKGDKDANFGVREEWDQELSAEGAVHVPHIRKLIEAYPGSRRPAQDMLADNTGTQYRRIIAGRGDKFLLAYTYTGAPVKLDRAKLGWEKIKTRWFNPRTGEFTAWKNSGATDSRFIPVVPDEWNGNDWVLVVEPN